MTVFTPALLLDMAIEAETLMVSIPHVIGTMMSKERWNARSAMNEAFDTALWMEQHGLAAAPMIGKYGNLPLKRGMKVRIKKGASIGSMGDRTSPVAGVSYVVTVHDSSEGATFQDHRDGCLTVRNQTVQWAGRGGYWCWTDATNVEIVDDIAQAA